MKKFRTLLIIFIIVLFSYLFVLLGVRKSNEKIQDLTKKVESIDTILRKQESKNDSEKSEKKDEEEVLTIYNKIDFGQYNIEKNTVPVSLSIIPKVSSQDLNIDAYMDEKSVKLKNKYGGIKYSGQIEMNPSEELSINLAFNNGEKSIIQALNSDMQVMPVGYYVFPVIDANINNIVIKENDGKYNVSGLLTISDRPSNEEITDGENKIKNIITSLKFVIAKNDVVEYEKEIDFDEYRNSGNFEQDINQHISKNDTDEVEIYVEGIDNLGIKCKSIIVKKESDIRDGLYLEYYKGENKILEYKK